MGIKEIECLDGAYGHTAHIFLPEDTQCDVCKKEKMKTLGFDTSEGEYALIRICLNCFKTLLDEGAVK